MKLHIIIPAHNEENRIFHTIECYVAFYAALEKSHAIQTELVIVMNGCTDNTTLVVKQIADSSKRIPIHILEIEKAGKGGAIKSGFEYALGQGADLIGFVDADMATSPAAFYQLIEKLFSVQYVDGVIASRYMPGAHITPERPKIKRYGSKLFYEPLIWMLFGIYYYDYQCGAKLFRRAVIARIVPYLTIVQWACDVELLYLCKKNRYNILEMPTTWHDQKNSKLKIMRNGLCMVGSLFVTRAKHVFK